MSVILKVNAGNLPPQELVDKLFATDPNMLGYATCILKGKENETLGMETLIKGVDDSFPTKDTFSEWLHNFDDDVVLLFDTIDPEKMLPEDMQPYSVVTDDEGVVRVAAMLSGDFSNFHVPDSNRADAYHAVAKVVVPTLDQIYDLTKDSPNSKTFTDAVDKPVFKEKFFNFAKKDGVLALIYDDVTGERPIKVYPASEGAVGSYDWGMVSNSLGFNIGEYPEKKPEESKDEPKVELTAEQKKQAKLDALKKSKGGSAVGGTAPKAVPEPSQKYQPEEVWLECEVPAEYHRWSHEKKKAWMNETFGTQLKGWKDFRAGAPIRWRPVAGVTPLGSLQKFRVATTPVVKDFKDLQGAQPEVPGTGPQPEVKETPKPPADGKDTAPHNLPVEGRDQTHNAPLTKPKPSEFGIAPVQSRKAYSDVFLESVKVKKLREEFKASKITDIEMAKKLTDKRESFFDASGGVDFKELAYLVPEFDTMIKDHVILTRLFMISVLAELFKTRADRDEWQALAENKTKPPEETKVPSEKMTIEQKMERARANQRKVA